MKKLKRSTLQETVLETSFMITMLSLFVLTAMSFISENNIIFPARMGIAITFLIFSVISITIYRIITKLKMGKNDEP